MEFNIVHLGKDVSFSFFCSNNIHTWSYFSSKTLAWNELFKNCSWIIETENRNAAETKRFKAYLNSSLWARHKVKISGRWLFCSPKMQANQNKLN